MNKIIRIAQVVGKMNNGGVESVIMNYYRNINHSKIQFDFIVDSDSEIPQKGEIEKLGGNIIYVSPYQNIFKYIKDLKKIFSENKYQIVHSHLSTLNLFPLYAAKKAKIKVRISHNHSTAGNGEFKRNLLKYALRPFAKIYPTHYFACGEYAGRWLFGNKTFNCGKVTVINNAIDIDKFLYNQDIRNLVRKDLGFENKIVIGHVGRFVSAKNHTKILDIFNEIYHQNTSSILILIGEGPLENTVRNKVNELGLGDAVKFLGVRKDVDRIMQSMDVFLLPSLYEGFPVVGIEAQAADLLCFLSDTISKEAKIIKKTTFISLNKEPSYWANEIIKSYNNFKRVNTKKEIVDSNFDIKVEAFKLQEFYMKVK